ncbi:MAG: hypothetical protein KAR07_11460 [Spirochaetes bacterium]|nr:hypothetical protein [Spirochaetota bacterium]
MKTNKYKIIYILIIMTMINFSIIHAFTGDIDDDHPDWGRIRVYYSVNSDYPYAYLEINKKYFGKIYRGQTRSFKVRSLKLMRIRIYRKEDVQTKFVRVRRGRSKSAFMELKWNSDGKNKNLSTLAVYYSNISSYQYAFIKINRRFLGKIRRGQTRYFVIPHGRCTIRLYRKTSKTMRRISIDKGMKHRITMRLNVSDKNQ